MVKIGWIGTGIMGSPMCGHLIDNGHEAFVYSRRKESATACIQKGATWCATPREVAQNADIIFCMVGYPADVRAVLIEGDDCALAGATSGKIIVDHTTSEPTLAKEMYALAKEQGVALLDAPVSGGEIGAKNGALAVMVGGDEETFDTVLPLFECYGKNVVHMGKAGNGQHTKAANQTGIAVNMVGTIELLMYAEKVGLDLEKVIDVVGSGAAGSWNLTNMGGMLVKDDYSAGFFLKHLLKDINIVLAEAKKLDLKLPGLELVQTFYDKAEKAGHGDLGIQAVQKILHEMNE